MAYIEDHRIIDGRQPRDVRLWLVASCPGFASAGHATGLFAGRSFVAYPADSCDVNGLERYMRNRSDFQRVRYNMHLPALRRGDHLSIYDPPLKYRTLD